MRGRSALLLVGISFGCMLLEACPPSGVTLTIRVQSGLRAGDELRHARASLRRGGSCELGAEIDSEGRAIERTDQASLGAGTFTIAELGPLEPGTYAVNVLARRPGPSGAESGSVLIERCVVTSITNDRVLRVPLTTGCIGVMCPAPGGSTAFTECLNGRCVDPRCDPDDPATAPLCCDRAVLGDLCEDDPTVCSAATECEAGPACAGAPRCVSGVCVEPDEDLCVDGEHCDASTDTCLPDDPGAFVDAGALDAGPIDAGSIDGGGDAAATDDAFSSVDAPFTPDAYRECREATDCADDGDVCTDIACAGTGLCMTTARSCDDGVDCTVDACSTPSGCQHTPDSSRCPTSESCHPTRGCEPADACAGPSECDDGLFCTDDACTAMRCVNTAHVCPPEASACASMVCDEDANRCANTFDPTSLTSPAHCGTSAAMCTAPCPSRPNATPTCAAGVCGTMCMTGFVDLDGSGVNGCEYACTFTSAVDLADAAAVDANCDGADGIVGSLDFIYVAPSGLSTGSGSTPATAVNVVRAFGVAAARGSPVTMMLASGNHTISLGLNASSGLILWGRYDASFRSRSGGASLVRSSDSRALTVSVPVTIDSVNFETTDQVALGEYTRTIWARGASSVVLRNLTVTAGRGAPGSSGAVGAVGAVGATGLDGNAGTMTMGAPAAGSGAGAGGIGGTPTGTGLMGMVGGTGTASCMAGGGGGSLLIGICSCSATTYASSGSMGRVGCVGTTGPHGATGTNLGTLGSSGWAPNASSGGGPGGVGVRGSGGGGGAAGDCSLGSAGGGGGAQGGAPGSGGSSGMPGTAGSGSFALLAFSSTLTLTNVTLVTRGGGDGGRGGSGGAGGSGGPGGDGGGGGSRTLCGGPGIIHGGVGGAGGTGGAGGQGGCGGGGAGGPSIGLFAASSTLVFGATITYSVASSGLGGAACASPSGGGAGPDGATFDQLLL